MENILHGSLWSREINPTNEKEQNIDVLLPSTETRLFKLVSLLISKGADVDITDFDLDTPLHWAALDDRLESLKELLKAKANLECVNRKGYTPVQVMVVGDNEKVFRHVIDNCDMELVGWGRKHPEAYCLMELAIKWNSR